MELKTIDDVSVGVSRSLEAELFSMDRTFEHTSAVRGKLAHALETIIFSEGGANFGKNIEMVPILLKTLSDQDRAQNAVVSAKLRKQETATALEAAKIISDSLASEEKVRPIPGDITAVPQIPQELEKLLSDGIKDTELKTNPMDFTD